MLGLFEPEAYHWINSVLVASGPTLYAEERGLEPLPLMEGLKCALLRIVVARPDPPSAKPKRVG
jgi:hypothetical protein